MFADQFLEFGKFAFQPADLGPALNHKIYQRPDWKITLGPEAPPFPFDFVRSTGDVRRYPYLFTRTYLSA